MKIAIISDTHFGDRNCVLADANNSYYKNLLQTLSANNSGEKYQFLIILGDVLDLAVSNYYDAINAAQPFFNGIKDLFDKIIIIPGNHDHDLWTMLQFQEQVVNQDSPKQNLWTASAFLYNINGALSLETKPDPDQAYHEGTFLDRIFPNKFIVASPNLYLVDKDKTILLTHGQYFEFAWAFLSDWTARAFRDDLNKIPMDGLQHILGDDFLTNQAICSGLGQSEVNLANIIQNLEHDFKEKNYKPIIKYIINFILSYLKGADIANEIHNGKQEISAFLKSVFASVIFTTKDHNDLDLLEQELKKELSIALTSKFTHLEKGFESEIISMIWDKLEIVDIIGYYKSLIETKNDDDDKNAQWINKYITASNSDAIDSKPKDPNLTIRSLQYMIFGHTHDPVQWNGGATSTINPCPLNTKQIANCGGWLMKNETIFCGAELFIYDSTTNEITNITF
jgi:predicted phosphodiesterase